MSLSVASLRQVQHINLTNGGFAHFAVTWRSRSRTADVSCLFKQPWCHDGFNHQASLTCIVTLVRSRVQDYCFDDTRNSSNYTLCCYSYKTGGAFSLLKSFFPWTSLCCETETDAACARICVFLLFIYSSFWLISYLIYTTNRNFSAFLPCMITHLLNLRISLAGLKGQTTNNGDTSDHFSQSINRFLWRVGSKLCPGFIWVSLNSNQELCIYLLFNYIFIFFISHQSHLLSQIILSIIHCPSALLVSFMIVIRTTAESDDRGWGEIKIRGVFCPTFPSIDVLSTSKKYAAQVLCSFYLFIYCFLLGLMWNGGRWGHLSEIWFLCV